MENTFMCVGRTLCVSNLSQSVFMEYGLCVYKSSYPCYPTLEAKNKVHVCLWMERIYFTSGIGLANASGGHR